MIRILFIILSVMWTGFVMAKDEQKPLVEYVWVKGKLTEIAKESQAVVTLTAQEIRALPVRDLVDLLAFLPGVHLNRKGPQGAAFDLTFRGGNFEQTLLMIDGIPCSNPQTGHFNGDLPIILDDIESVQLIRGGNGARYGSVFAGAINIISKRKQGFNVDISGGEHGLFASTLGAGLNLAKGLTVQASLSHNQSDGFHAGRELKNWVIGSSLEWTTHNSILTAYFGKNDKDFGAAGYYAPYPSWEESAASLFNLSWRYRNSAGAEPLRLAVSYQLHDDYFELDRTRPDFFKNRSQTERILIQGEAHFLLANMPLRLGSEWIFDRMDSQNMGRPQEHSGSLYANGSWQGNNLTIDWGLRSEWWSQQSPWFTYYGGLSYQPAPAWLLKASMGRNYRKPSFTERLYVSPTNRGDTNLSPEFSTNYELNLISPNRHGAFEMSIFYRHQSQTIDWINVATNGGTLWQALNLSPYSVRGVELSYTGEWGRQRLTLAAERLWSEGAPGIGYTSKYGFRFPDLSLRAAGVHPLSDRLAFSWNYLFKRLLASAESAHLLDVSFKYSWSKNFSLLLMGQNLLNEQLEEIQGVKISGRWVSAGMRFQF